MGASGRSVQRLLEVLCPGLTTFTRVWKSLDPNGTGFIDPLHLTTLLVNLDSPLGVKSCPHERLMVQELLFQTDIPLRKQGVFFFEVLHSLMARVALSDLTDDEKYMVDDQLIRLIPEEDTKENNVAHYFSALVLVSSIRGILARKNIKEVMFCLREPNN